MIKQIFFTTLTVSCLLLSCTKQPVGRDQVWPLPSVGSRHSIDFTSEGPYEFHREYDDYNNLFDVLSSEGSGKGSISGGVATMTLNATTDFGHTYCIASGPWIISIPPGTTYTSLYLHNSDGSFTIKVGGVNNSGVGNFEGLGFIIAGSGAFQTASSQLLKISGTADTTTKKLKLQVTGPIFL